jgi:hypothetical protein
MIARIAEHRRLAWVLEEISVWSGTLDAELPPDRRKAGMIDDRGNPDIGKDDDPRWTAITKEWWAASDHLDKLTWSFIDNPPTDFASAVALMAYATEYEKELRFMWRTERFYVCQDGSVYRFNNDWKTALTVAVMPFVVARLAQA